MSRGPQDPRKIERGRKMTSISGRRLVALASGPRVSGASRRRTSHRETHAGAAPRDGGAAKILAIFGPTMFPFRERARESGPRSGR